MSRQRSPHSVAAAAAAVSDASKAEFSQQESQTPTVHAQHAAAIPQTSRERLVSAIQPDDPDTPSTESGTVLYLAYGSNLCAETFKGKRGIRPLSQINVSAPTLRLAMSLPGVPYMEPAFANVGFRKLPGQPKLPDNPGFPPFEVAEYAQGEWDGGVMGVVYEVTKEDYRQIMRTEGGGSGYQEIFVPCVPLPPSANVPERPTFPNLPKPFIAKTLCAPPIPSDKLNWWQRLLKSTQRPDPDYAQGSARYLKLITDGAREHSLPDAYQDWLQSLQPYTTTDWRQKLGKILVVVCFGPPVLGCMSIAKLFADENGRSPPAVTFIMTAIFGSVWVAYDWVLKPLFGDGERTQSIKSSRRRRLSMGQPVKDEEKEPLLQ